MPIRVTAWQPVPGQPLPEPLLEDDSNSFPVEIVTRVRDWLGSDQLRPYDREFHPTSQTIGASTFPRFKVRSTHTPNPAQGFFEFERGTAEVLLRDKQRQIIVAKFHYHEARCIGTGKSILGPRINVQQLERI